MGAKIHIDVPAGGGAPSPFANTPQVRDEIFKQYSAPMVHIRSGATIAILCFMHEEITHVNIEPGTAMEKALILDFEVAMPLSGLKDLKTTIDAQLAQYGIK